MRWTLLPVLAALSVVACPAQTWMPDPEFGVDGRVFFDGFTGSDELMDLWLDADDGILMLDWSTIFDVNQDLMVLARFTADGQLDEDFGDEGVASAVQVGGSLVGRAVERMSDGRIMVVGSVTNFPIQRDALFLRYTAEGFEDLSFGTFGRVVIDLGANEVLMDLIARENGSVLAAGRRDGEVLLMRITEDGELDETFGTGGVLELAEGAGSPTAQVRLQRRADGGFLLMARVPDGFILYAFDAEDAFDPAFGSGGFVFVPYAGETYAMAITPEGEVLVSGTGGVLDDSTEVCLGARVDKLLADGLPDGSFGDGGVVLDGATEVCDIFFDVAVQDDGRVLATGTFTTDLAVGMDLAVLRYLPDGTRDAAFGDNGLIQVDADCGGIDVAFALAIQSDGRIIVGGVSNCTPFPNDIVLVRLYPAITTAVAAVDRTHPARLFPNPVTAQGMVQWDPPSDGPVAFSVLDAMGRLVMPQRSYPGYASSTLNIPFDASLLPSGVYAAALVQGDQRAVVRFVVE